MDSTGTAGSTGSTASTPSTATPSRDPAGSLARELRESALLLGLVLAVLGLVVLLASAALLIG